MNTQSRPVDLLIDRILRNPMEKCTDRDLAFRLVALRRWVMRVGAESPEAEFHTERGGERLGWMLTRRGRQVAEEELVSRATSGRRENAA